MAHVRRVVDATAVHVRAMEGFSSEPSPVSRTDGEPYRVLERSIRQAAPDAVVARTRGTITRSASTSTAFSRYG